VTLRKKTLIIIGLTLLGLIVVLSATLSRILVRGFDRIEDRAVRGEIARVQGVFQDSIDGLNVLCRE
jgi:adenylate cyclase